MIFRQFRNLAIIAVVAAFAGNAQAQAVCGEYMLDAEKAADKVENFEEKVVEPLRRDLADRQAERAPVARREDFVSRKLGDVNENIRERQRQIREIPGNIAEFERNAAKFDANGQPKRAQEARNKAARARDNLAEAEQRLPELEADALVRKKEVQDLRAQLVYIDETIREINRKLNDTDNYRNELVRELDKANRIVAMCVELEDRRAGRR